MKNNTYLREWRCILPSLTNGHSMFNGCTSLILFTSVVPNLTNGYWMFRNCSNLTSFNSILHSLTNGVGMFSNCSALNSFPSALPSLIEGTSMFSSCTSLTTFSSDLSSLTDGISMFYDCSNLTTFTSDLGSLKSGYEMFSGCKLDAESLSYIANNINDISDLDKDNDEHWTYEVLGETKTLLSLYRGRIDIGHNESIPSDVIIECGNKLIDKGWTVNFNDSIYVYSNFPSPYDVSEANGWCPDAYKSEEDNWNTKIYEGHSLIITKITSNGEMLNDE